MSQSWQLRRSRDVVSALLCQPTLGQFVCARYNRTYTARGFAESRTRIRFPARRHCVRLCFVFCSLFGVWFWVDMCLMLYIFVRNQKLQNFFRRYIDIHRHMCYAPLFSFLYGGGLEAVSRQTSFTHRHTHTHTHIFVCDPPSRRLRFFLRKLTFFASHERIVPGEVYNAQMASNG